MLVALLVPTTLVRANGGSGGLSETTTVTIGPGGGDIPVVDLKWEQQPVTVNPDLEDGDPLHAVPGFQILPPMVKCETKTIEYYAVVTDSQDGGNLAQAFADVYHPYGSPEPYGPSVIGGIDPRPYFKYEIPFTDLQAAGMTKQAAMAIVQTAYDAGLITFASGVVLGPIGTPGTVLYQIDKDMAHLWMGEAEIDYEQPAGMYDVGVFGYDSNNNLSNGLWNQFEYVAVAGIEVDFAQIAFGAVNLGQEKMIPGDVIWNSPDGVNNATVRNIGNTWVSVQLVFDDMAFGQDVTGNWNVRFDARMGSDQAYYVGNILPYAETTLQNALGLSTLDELDLSIRVLKGSGTHAGTLTLSAVERAFTYTPVVGVPDPCPA